MWRATALDYEAGRGEMGRDGREEKEGILDVVAIAHVDMTAIFIMDQTRPHAK